MALCCSAALSGLSRIKHILGQQSGRRPEEARRPVPAAALRLSAERCRLCGWLTPAHACRPAAEHCPVPADTGEECVKALRERYEKPESWVQTERLRQFANLAGTGLRGSELFSRAGEVLLVPEAGRAVRGKHPGQSLQLGLEANELGRAQHSLLGVLQLWAVWPWL